MPPAKKTLSQATIRAMVDRSHERIDNWKHLHELLETMRDSGWIFRGVSSPKHYLLPSIGREVVYGPYKRAQEESLFREFRNRAIGLISDPRLYHFFVGCVFSSIFCFRFFGIFCFCVFGIRRKGKF